MLSWRVGKVGDIARMVKLFESASSPEAIHHQTPMLKLVFHLIILHTHGKHGTLDCLINRSVEETDSNSDRYEYAGQSP